MTGHVFRWFLAIVIIIDLVACSHRAGDIPVNENPTGGNTGNNGIICNSSTVYFRQQVLPVLISNCALSGCHDNTSHQDGVVLTSYENVISTAEVRPGFPGNSKLYEVLIDNDLDKQMPRPPQNPLSNQQIQVVYNWIQQGAKDLVCQNLCDSSQFTYSVSIKSIIENKCQGCHSGANAQGGIDLSTYQGIKNKITDGRFWGAINQLPGFSAMPKNGSKLSDCEITQIRKWIDAGSLNN